nr:hypothetical protein [Daphnia magna]
MNQGAVVITVENIANVLEDIVKCQTTAEIRRTRDAQMEESCRLYIYAQLHQPAVGAESKQGTSRDVG